MIRSEARYSQAISNRAHAVGANGASRQTAPIVSPQAYVIRDVMQSGSNWAIRLDVIPKVTPASLRVRIDGGFHGVTRGEHPAAGDWTVTPTANPFVFVLDGSTYVASSVFQSGHCYVPGTPINSSEELRDLAIWCRDNAPATVYLPLGGMYVQTKAISFPESTNLIGHGGQTTFFFMADQDDTPVPGETVRHVMGTGLPDDAVYRNTNNFLWQGITVYGNRGHQIWRRGFHAVNLSGGTDQDVPISGTFVDFHVFGSGGYGLSGGNGSSKRYLSFYRCSFFFSGSDLIDFKNRTELPYAGAESGFGIRFIDCDFGWHSMLDEGKNLNPLVPVPANGIGTTAGSTICTIPGSIAPAAQPGNTLTLYNAPTLNGINLTGSFRVLSANYLQIRFDTQQVANATGTGGGSGITSFLPVISLGDAILDMRGQGWFVSNCSWVGELYGRTGFRQRGGTEGPGNGLGATGCQVSNIYGIDLTPSWVIDTEGSGRGFAAAFGIDANFDGIYFSTTGGAAGIIVGPGSERAKISNFNLKGCRTGVRNYGKLGKFTHGSLVDCIATDIYNWGGTGGTAKALGADPLHCATVGTAVVIVAAVAHGLTTGDLVSFRNVEDAEGLVFEEFFDYTATVIDPDTFSVVVSGASTSTVAFGGDAIIISRGVNDASRNTFFDIDFQHSQSNTCLAINNGYIGGAGNGRASYNTFSLIRNIGAGGAPVYLDCGEGTTWGPNNVGLPNHASVDTISVPALNSAAWREITSYSVASSSPARFTALGSYNEIRVQGIDLTHDSATPVYWRLSLSSNNLASYLGGSYSRMGSSLPGLGNTFYVSGAAVATATPFSFNAVMTNFNQPSRLVANIEGGVTNATTAATTGPGYTSLTGPFNALALDAGDNGARITGGTIRIFGR